jgi:hypothetical protein
MVLLSFVLTKVQLHTKVHLFDPYDFKHFDKYFKRHRRSVEFPADIAPNQETSYSVVWYMSFLSNDKFADTYFHPRTTDIQIVLNGPKELCQ